MTYHFKDYYVEGFHSIKYIIIALFTSPIVSAGSKIVGICNLRHFFNVVVYATLN